MAEATAGIGGIRAREHIRGRVDSVESIARRADEPSSEWTFGKLIADGSSAAPGLEVMPVAGLTW